MNRLRGFLPVLQKKLDKLPEFYLSLSARNARGRVLPLRQCDKMNSCWAEYKCIHSLWQTPPQTCCSPRLSSQGIHLSPDFHTSPKNESLNDIKSYSKVKYSESSTYISICTLENGLISQNKSSCVLSILFFCEKPPQRQHELPK